MADHIENLLGSAIQHGPHNDRIYVMHLNPARVQSFIVRLHEMAANKGYGKILAKIPASAWQAFACAGYVTEAVVPGFFNGRGDGLFIAKYLDPGRSEAGNLEALKLILAQQIQPSKNIKASQKASACTPADAAEISAVYQQVFDSYPLPIEQPEKLRQLMQNNVCYYCVRKDDRIVAVAAADIDLRGKNAEMTDFATLPPYRGKGMAGALLRHMERDVRSHRVITAYTIARAASAGMNAVFRNNGYRYAGLLKNNSQISGSLQSMAVWYKQLPGDLD